MTADERAPVILLVDDDADHRAIYAMALEAAGFEVVEATDGTSAIRQARTIRPDVIVLDLHMPRLSGWQACRRLKASKETSRIPVVALTVDPTAQAEHEAWQAGCDRFIAKGSGPRRVVEAIRDVLAL